jgi:serine/threonine protein kinase
VIGASEDGSLYIVRYFSSWIEDDRVYIVTELCEGGSADSFVGSSSLFFSSAMAFNMLRDMARALDFLHNMTPHAIAHLDVKPANILMKQGRYYATAVDLCIYYCAYMLTLCTVYLVWFCPQVQAV